LISAYPDREFHRLGLNAGAIAFLDKKGLDAAAVRQVIDELLRNALHRPLHDLIEAVGLICAHPCHSLLSQHD
jgi:hypothetical protein